jgi:hypothetical protein
LTRVIREAAASIAAAGHLQSRESRFRDRGNVQSRDPLRGRDAQSAQAPVLINGVTAAVVLKVNAMSPLSTVVRVNFGHGIPPCVV